jgi:anthranilate synthase component 2
VYADKIVHGKSTAIEILDDTDLLRGIPNGAQVARYHSLAVEESTLPDTVKVLARTKDDDSVIMAVEYRPTSRQTSRQARCYGVQFHPESILTPYGKQILKNFLEVGAI